MSNHSSTFTKLSVVIPAFNSSGWITQCLQHLSKALRNAEITDAEVIVVDDGSTDDTGEEARRFSELMVKVISQENQGRFLARENGLANCTGSHILFLDTRVFLAETSLTFVLPFLQETNTSLWTAHVEANTTGNPIARFWRAIESIFWRRYMKNPSTTSFGLEDFDFYPKGTTALIAPTGLIRNAIAAFRPTVTDWRKVNDDTALLRYAAERTRINISPQYACTYNARTNLKAFLHHANHRGSVLIDGYLRKGTRLNIPIWLTLVLAPMGLSIGLLFWELALAALLLVPIALFVGLSILNINKKDAMVLAALFWPFSISYLCGMYWGLWLKLEHRH
jgi:glycosyltransferase involved in cell wall biosynthesis